MMNSSDKMGKYELTLLYSWFLNYRMKITPVGHVIKLSYVLNNEMVINKIMCNWPVHEKFFNLYAVRKA